ncbi:MAG: MaoC family dehydratase N-terminal domain-containing protein [Deltaproteobacteria bacterium]|nr:MaoC family dehydratase N-terminal domain-containing protein [Deltaproteobacteria bacterium]
MRTLYFEDYTPEWSASGGAYLVTEQELLEMGERFDPRPFHTDPEAARESHFGGLIASGAHVFCIRTRLVHELQDGPALLAGLGLEEMDLPNPVRPGDELSLSQVCIEARPSRSRPDRGIVKLRNTLSNQRGEPVLTMVTKMLVARRSEAD